MQKEYALLNLKEAKEAIEAFIAEMESDPSYDTGNYMVDIQHIYWHLNSAWNGREFDLSSQALTDGMHESFIQFPQDIEM